MKNLYNKSKPIILLSTITLVAFSLLFPLGVNSPDVLAVTAGPTISITTIEDYIDVYSSPFDFNCSTNPLFSPIIVIGEGSGSASPGNIEQYGVQINWGDGVTEEASSVFTPSSGHADFDHTFEAGPHSYGDGTATITVLLYHQNPSGQDNQIDASFSIPICVFAEPPILTVKKEVINDDGGSLEASDFLIHVKIDGQDIAGSPAPGSETGTVYTLAPGTFIVSEDPVQDYTQTIIGDCASDGSITLNSGDFKTCTIINDDVLPECIPEGGSGAVVPGGPQCCEGLITIGCDEPDQSGNCPIEPCAGAFYCTNCGDGVCGLGENICNCSEDCEEKWPECTPEAVMSCDTGQLGICAAGTQTCDQYGYWGDCIRDEEPVAEICDDGLDNNCDGYTDCDDEGCFSDPFCEEECIPEGGSGAVVPGELDCCEGLIQIGCDEPDQFGNCPIEPCTGAFYCTNCGDGICGPGENKCNCPEDCEEPEVTTIKTFKVVCEAEEYLPNWATSGTQAGEPSTIGENTAQDYVAASQEKCWLEAGWDFQWGFNGEVSSPNGSDIGPGGPGWNNFDSSTGVGTPAEVQISDLKGTSRIWVKENLKENYLPFANPPGDSQDNVSAELLCHDDILNYDNYDFINNPQLEETYYCVAFNVLKEEPEPVCGNSILEGDEECDDGNLDDGDGCSSICEIEILPGDIIINEIMQNPDVVDDVYGEWFELYNATGGSIDLEGCIIRDEDGEDHTINASLVVSAGGYAVLARNGDAGQNGGVTADYIYSSFLLANADDEVILECNQTEIDRVEYDGGPNFPDPEGASMILEDLSFDNNIGSNWCVSRTPFGGGDLGTPGSQNDSCEIEGSIIAGCKYNDANNNNQIDPAEDKLGGWTIALEIQDGLDWIDVTSAATQEEGDNQGCYLFEALEIGNYRISERLNDQPGWVQTYPSTLSHIISLGEDETVSNIDFANYYEPVCGNSVLDDGEECDDGNTEDDDGCSATCTIEEQPGCEPGETQSCNTGLLGICALGAQTCTELGVWGECVQNEEPTNEVCNDGLDNDCDGSTDCGDGDCASYPACHGGPGPDPLIIFNEKIEEILEDTVTVTWSTSTYATSRVVYDTASHPDVGNPPNYGYTYSTSEDVNKVKFHRVTITGLTSKTTYFWRPISHKSWPEVLGEELTFTFEEPECEPGETQSCDTGQLGICALGTQTCDQNGFWGECVQDEEPIDEICDDGLDNNCDGDTDCDDSVCVSDPFCIGGGPECTLGETQSCNTGLLGICALGTQTCIQGGFWGECVQNNNPVSEICDNGLDDDCDGYVDEADPNCAGPAPECTDYYKDSDADGYGITDDSKCLTEPTGDYIVTQTGDCDDDNPEINPGIIEVCDNQLDDDCDEDIDCDDEDCAEDQICAVEEELEEEAETGLNRFLAAVGNIFGIGNLCWALILLLVILLVVFYLMKKGIKKQDEGLWWIIGIVTVIAVLIALAQKLCWVLIFPIILLIILMVLDYMKKNKEKKSEPTF